MTKGWGYCMSSGEYCMSSGEYCMSSGGGGEGGTA